MDFDDIQQNMNTRVVFKEPRGLVRWLQLLFAVIATATVVDFYTSVGVDITCPTQALQTIPVSQPSIATLPVAPATTLVQNVAPAVQPVAVLPAAVQPVAVQPVAVQPAAQPVVQPVVAQPAAQPQALAPALPQPQAQVAQQQIRAELMIRYPFDFSQQKVNNSCPGRNFTYTHVSSLSSSPQFFVTAAVLSILYASTSLVVYCFFSSTYDSIPVIPVADLLATAVLCLIWFIASSSFSSGVSLLKTTSTYENIKQVVCPPEFENLPGVKCNPIDPNQPTWKSLNIALISGFTSFFLWGSGMWFVYKETYFHGPRDQFGNRL